MQTEWTSVTGRSWFLHLRNALFTNASSSLLWSPILCCLIMAWHVGHFLGVWTPRTSSWCTTWSRSTIRISWACRKRCALCAAMRWRARRWTTLGNWPTASSTCTWWPTTALSSTREARFLGVPRKCPWAVLLWGRSVAWLVDWFT